jgi:hypothetical protein
MFWPPAIFSAQLCDKSEFVSYLPFTVTLPFIQIQSMSWKSLKLKYWNMVSFEEKNT